MYKPNRYLSVVSRCLPYDSVYLLASDYEPGYGTNTIMSFVCDRPEYYKYLFEQIGRDPHKYFCEEFSPEFANSILGIDIFNNNNRGSLRTITGLTPYAIQDLLVELSIFINEKNVESQIEIETNIETNVDTEYIQVNGKKRVKI